MAVQLRQVAADLFVEKIDAQGIVLGDLDRQQTLALDSGQVRRLTAVNTLHQAQESNGIHAVYIARVLGVFVSW
jgi:hypothetical protein